MQTLSHAFTTLLSLLCHPLSVTSHPSSYKPHRSDDGRFSFSGAMQPLTSRSDNPRLNPHLSELISQHLMRPHLPLASTHLLASAAILDHQGDTLSFDHQGQGQGSGLPCKLGVTSDEAKDPTDD